MLVRCGTGILEVYLCSRRWCHSILLRRHTEWHGTLTRQAFAFRCCTSTWRTSCTCCWSCYGRHSAVDWWQDIEQLLQRYNTIEWRRLQNTRRTLGQHRRSINAKYRIPFYGISQNLSLKANRLLRLPPPHPTITYFSNLTSLVTFTHNTGARALLWKLKTYLLIFNLSSRSFVSKKRHE